MKKGKSILTRCLALVLALVLIVSSANLGAALKASAESGKEVSYGKLMADTYELADWEEALLSSGLLDPHFGYCAAPTADDKLVSIDEAGKKIVAKDHCTDGSDNAWIPVSADIMVNNESVETIEIVDNEGTYTYAGDEFSVVVTYKMYTEVKASTQDMMLNTGVYLNEALANLETVYGQDSNLMIVEEAVGMLMSIKDLSPDGQTQFSEGFRAAVEALNAQKENGGLELRNLIATYAEGTAYMYENWGAYAEATAETYGYLNAIHTDSLVQGGGIDQLLEVNDSIDGTSNAPLWRTFKGAVKELVEALEPVAHDAWNVQKNYFVQPGAELDALLKNVGEPTKVNIVEKLLVDTATVQATLNMQTVVASVELKVVEDIPNSTNLIPGGTAQRVILSVKQNASEAEINAAIEASGVVARAQAAWGEAYKAEHYEASTAVSELNGNILVTITYAPVNYTITYNYQDAKTVPYGYTEVLDYHEDAEKAYDYTVNGEPKMAGWAFYITGDTAITRTEGRAYSYTTLYSVIGESMGDWNHYEVLSSGALKGDAAIYYRTPLAPEMTLSDKVLTVESTIASDFAGLNWVPYSYSNGAEGTNYFKGTNVINGYNQRQAQVNYILRLTNVDVAEAKAMLELARTIDAEEQMQTAGMEFLMDYYDDIGTLNKGYLEGLISIIKNFDFTPGDGANGYNNYEDAKNLELIAYFNGIIGKMVAKEGGYIDTKDNNLMLYTMLTEYKNGGLAYYYKDSAEIIRQVTDLGSFLNQLIADEEYQAALALLLEDQGMSEYIDKISKLGQAMTDVKTNLVPTNEMIDTTKDLKALVAAVSDDAPSANPNATDVPAIISQSFTVVDDSAVVLIADLYVDGKLAATVTSDEYDRWSVLTGAMNNELLDKIWAKYDELLGEKGDYYSFNNSEWAKLDDLIGTELTENLSVKVSADAAKYTVKVEGQADQTITINDLTIDLPQHENHPNTVYEYTVKGETTRATSYTFTAEDLDALFVDGTYAISVETLEIGQQMMDNALEKLNNNSAGNTYEIVDGTLIANVAATADGVTAFATGLLDTGYGYIGVNGRPMMYSVEGEGLEISIQSLIDAVYEDSDFSRDAVIALGNNGEGKALSATLQLGIDSEVMYEEAMPFVLNLHSLPEQMATVAKGLEAGKNNFDFYSNGDHVYVYVDLPEKVYEVYLTAMWGVGELDKTDLNAINNQIALNFLYDYVMLIAESDVTAMTFENTLRIFDKAANEVLDKDIPDYDIAAYDKYLQLVKQALTGDGVVVESDEETMSLSVTGQGKHLLTLAEGLGINLDAYRTQLGMIKEFKDGQTLTGKVIATLANTSVDFEALVIDVNEGIDGVKEIKNIDNRDEAVDEAIDLIKGLGLANAIDYTTDLPARASEIEGKAAIMLLDNVDGDLILNDTTILDLNGKTINGSLVANGTVLVMDSTLDTANAGKITGSVSGNAIILAGNYNADVAAYLPDGYLQVNGNVRNALYVIESPEKGDLIVTVNTDVYMSESVDGYLPSVKALAADLAVDVAFNYYLTSMLSVDGNTIFNIDVNDIVGIVDSNTKASDIINELLCMFDAKGTSAFINAVSADLLDFAAIEQAVLNGTEIVSYDLTVAPYGIEIEHIEDGDYLTVNVGSVESHADAFKVALKLDGDVNTARLAKVVGELADIVVAENTYAIIDLEQPYYSNRTLWLEGSGKASLDLDLSKNPVYRTIIAVVLAYGNSDKAEALIDAIDDQEALKEVFNTISVEEVFTALKALEREVSFTEMAESLGVDIDYTKAAEYEDLVHILLAAAGYALEKLDITGYTDKTMGMIEEGDSGRYTLTKSAAKSGDITRRGFTLDASAVVEHVTLSVKIFGEDCLWGDANHDGVVDAMDATLVLQYHVDSLAEGQFFCTKRTDVNGDGAIDAMDATLILQHFVGTITEFPVEQ